ncbi:uncharacterized protein LOC111643202 [Copidosoma floridanum]|uniref:uncharacterized protein LOC111643202 n=1 Tax=Copidosoma floridanum TaxID=29053 RepID=UPI000C6F7256|nr:uncharacterized protein LOC111643202 [Copidosoma floridanum]
MTGGGNGDGNGSGGTGNGGDVTPPGQVAVQTVHNCKLPPFWRASPEAWFFQIESAFNCNQVRSDTTRFNLVVAALDSEVAQELLDVLRAVPDTGKYDYLKRHVLARFADTEEKRLRTLFTQLHVDGRTPSQLLRHMRSLAGNKVSDEVLKVKWLDLLPVPTQRIMRVLKNNTLDELAEAADHMADTPALVDAIRPQGHQRTPSPNRASSLNFEAALSAQAVEIAALRATMTQLLATVQKLSDSSEGGQRSGRQRNRNNSRSNNRSRSPTPSQNGYCFYHHRFGMDARKCEQPCAWKSLPGQGN